MSFRRLMAVCRIVPGPEFPQNLPGFATLLFVEKSLSVQQLFVRGVRICGATGGVRLVAPTDRRRRTFGNGVPKLTDQPDHAQSSASASQQAAGAELSDQQPVADALRSDSDALNILLQASAAAEAVQQQFRDLQAVRAELVAERHQLSADRAAFEARAQQFAEQVANDRTARREVTAEYDERQKHLQQQQQDVEQQQLSLQENREELESERQRLHDAVSAELAREQQTLQRQRDVLDDERQRLADRIEQLERQHAERMQQTDELLQTERENMRDSVRTELAGELGQLHRERQEWISRKEAEQHELQQQEDDLQQQRELFGEQLETEHRRLREEIEKRRQALLAEQNNLQRRYRFQFEHLARAREDFEGELRELRRDQQLFRTERTNFEEQHRLQFAQLQRIRQALMQRDASLNREQKVIDRYRVSADLDRQRQHDRLQEYQASVSQDLESRNRQLQQAEQSSAETARRVEQRLRHVNQMRAELDTKQRDILEQRLLLQELQAGDEGDSRTPEQSPGYRQARKAVETFFEQLHQHLQADRDRLEKQAVELSERQEQFRRDRNDLENWVCGAGNETHGPIGGFAGR